MPRISHARRAPSGGAVRRRQTEWFASVDITGATALPAASFIFSQSLSAIELAKRPFTIVRTVGVLLAEGDQIAANEQAFGAVGAMVVSEKAIATGVTAIPDPITQEASDEWFLYKTFGAFSNPLMRDMFVFEFDSRAQRKVQDGEDIAFMVANASAANGLNFILKFRLLVKLS